MAFQPQDHNELQTAVDVWINDIPTALSTYGEINDWDISLISDMTSLFQSKTTFNDDSFLLIESIPSRETRMFVERVLTNLVIYELINHNSFNYADELIATNTILIND